MASSEPAPPSQRSIPMLVAAGVLVVGVVAAVLAFGVERPPEVEPLAAEPTRTPPASIAWLDSSGTERCLRVADPDGEVREVTCDNTEGDLVGWTRRGILLRQADDIAALDARTGERAVLADAARPGHGSRPRAQTERQDGRLTVLAPGPAGDGPDEDRTVVWETDAPDSYDIVTAVPAPDGATVALSDNAGRLLVAPADGSAPPRLWSEQAPRYAEPVWEGTDPDAQAD